LFGLTVARNATHFPAEVGDGRWMWLVVQVVRPLLLNFCVRLRSKLSKINFHVEKVQIAGKAARKRYGGGSAGWCVRVMGDG